MRLFKIKGGIHPDGRKELAENEKIEQIPLPTLMRIPLKQHTGTPANSDRRKRRCRKKGTGAGAFPRVRYRPPSMPQPPGGSSPSGALLRHMPRACQNRPSRSGLMARTNGATCHLPSIRLQPNRTRLPAVWPKPVSWALAARPSRRPSNSTCAPAGPLHTLVINAAECEPYITCDDRLMRERAAEILDGVAIICHTIGVTKALIGVEKNKPDAIKALKKEAQAQNRYDIKVVEVPTRYPTGLCQASGADPHRTGGSRRGR